MREVRCDQTGSTFAEKSRRLLGLRLFPAASCCFSCAVALRNHSVEVYSRAGERSRARVNYSAAESSAVLCLPEVSDALMKVKHDVHERDVALRAVKNEKKNEKKMKRV